MGFEPKAWTPAVIRDNNITSVTERSAQIHGGEHERAPLTPSVTLQAQDALPGNDRYPSACRIVWLFLNRFNAGLHPLD